jgi:enoyl-CoA hydratase/carnithine racemase
MSYGRCFPGTKCDLMTNGSAMQDQEIQCDIADGVAVVTLNAPERRNGLTPAMARQLIECFDRIDEAPAVAVTIIRGAGGSFCAGGDIATLQRAGQDPAADSSFEEMGVIYNSFLRLRQLSTPSIAAVRGSAVGAGLNLMLAADLRIVSTTARLMSGFLRRSLHPGGGHFVMLSQLAGREAAAAMALFGVEITGKRAFELGLAWEAVDDLAVDDRALEIARLAAIDPALIKLAATCFRTEVDASHLPLAVANQAERSNQMWSLRRAAG